MDNTYKGIPLPEVVKDGNWYYIADDTYGWFEGYTAQVVMIHWQNAVNSGLRREAIDSGLYSYISEDQFGCFRCGALVFDTHIHNNSH